MSSDPAYGKRLSSVLRSIGKVDPPATPDSDDPMDHLVFAFLLWEASMNHASRAFKKIEKEIVDFNDLRVTMPDEIVTIIGANYPRAMDRTQRLRACLRSLYNREHHMSLDGMLERPKREVRAYLETLDGMTPFVVERVMLLGFGAHGVPLDDQIRTALVAAEALDPALSIPDACAWLTRQIRADQAETAHYKLQTWATSRSGGAKRSRSAASSRKKTSSKKKTTRKTKKKSAASGRKRTASR